MNKYLIITLILIIVVVLYLKYNKQGFSKQGFSKQGFSNTLDQVDPVDEIHRLDTRYRFPTVPPVNPVTYKTMVLNEIPADKDLYSNQEYISEFILDQNDNLTNQLNYSGGTTQMIKIPLQMNEPFNEQLRSQEILITPYNRIKYSTTKC